MKTISFVIPVYNEEARINKTFEALERARMPRGLRLEEIIFVDDGSNDKTLEMVHKFMNEEEIFAGESRAKATTGISVISYKRNRGKGYAIRQGMLASKSDYTLFFDADMSTPLSELNKFMPFIKRGASVVIGTRKNGHSTVIKHQPLVRELLGKCFTKFTQIVLQVDATDFTCGFKLFSRRATQHVFKRAQIDGWGYDAEIIFLSQKSGYFIREQAVTWANDERTKVNLRSAIIKTLLELGQIRWLHTFKPLLVIDFAVELPALNFRLFSKGVAARMREGKKHA